MTTDVKKAEKPIEQHQVKPLQAQVEAPAPLTLDPTIMAAIQASVEVAMKSAVGVILEQLKPATLPSTPAPSIPVRNAGAPTPIPQVGQLSNGNYVSKLKGIPVEPGQDLRHVHPGVIQNWFNTVENRWKEQYNKRKMGGAPVDLSWTRG